MSAKNSSLLLFTIGLALLLPPRLAPSAQSDQAVRPAKVTRIQNLEINSNRSYRPAYLPREWGRLVAVQPLGSTTFLLFFQADGGEIYLARLIQRGSYLYVDTYDQGGVTLVIPREP